MIHIIDKTSSMSSKNINPTAISLKGKKENYNYRNFIYREFYKNGSVLSGPREACEDITGS